MKVKIINENGVAGDTKVFNEENGEDLAKRLPIRRIQWTGEVGGVCVATIELVAMSIQVKGEATFVIPHPVTGQVKELKSVEFMDGTVWKFDKE